MAVDNVQMAVDNVQMAVDNDFRPALIVVDMQEDFCPPNGALAVPGGREVIEPINKLLALPFVLKVATKDWHPANHISFAANHAGKREYVDTAEVTNPLNASERQTTRLWPVHCVQGSAGAEFAAGLDVSRLDRVILKGTDARFEIYSPFHDSFSAPRVCDTGLAALLGEHAVSDVFVVGLAGDYCVGACAVDAADEGFRTYLIEDCTRPVDAADWPRYKESLLLLRRGQEGKGKADGDEDEDGDGAALEGSRAKSGGGVLALLESHQEVLRLMTAPEGRRHIWGRSVCGRMQLVTARGDGMGRALRGSY